MPKSQNKGTSNKRLFRKQGNILGVSITSTPAGILLDKIYEYLVKKDIFEAKKPLFITTPNPEQVLLAQNDNEFARVLRKSSISLCDGIGLLIADEYLSRSNSLKNKKTSRKKLKFLNKVDKYTRKKFKFRKLDKIPLKSWLLFFKSALIVIKRKTSPNSLRVIKGRDFVLSLLNMANEKRYKVFLLGSTISIISQTKELLSKKYPAVRFDFDYNLKLNKDGVPVDTKQKTNEAEVVKRINKFHPKMLFVGFGAPKQEKWVYRHLKDLNTDLVMVCGGTFDYIAGTRKSVPEVVSRLGMEWLWRLLTGSQSLDRVFNAVVRFPMELVSN